MVKVKNDCPYDQNLHSYTSTFLVHKECMCSPVGSMIFIIISFLVAVAVDYMMSLLYCY